jgi:hypothetical protein
MMVAAVRILLGMVLVMASAGWAGAESGTSMPSSRPLAPELLVVTDGEPWLLAAACPLVARLRTGDGGPLLLATGKTPDAPMQDFLRDLAPQRVLMLTVAGTSDPLPGRAKQVVSVSAKPLAATRHLASAYWERPSLVVAARNDAPNAAILASAWAAQRGAPLLIYEAADRAADLRDAVARLGAATVMLVGEDRDADESLRAGKAKVEMFSSARLADRLAEALASHARTVIVARVPEASAGVGGTAWLASYMSLVRGAPVVLVHSGKAVVVEQEVAALVKRAGLRPRTITLLGDYDSLRVHRVDTEVPRRESGRPGMLSVEPCLPTGLDQTAAVGVGRIPLATLDDASLLVTRGYARRRLLAARHPELLMLANAATEQWQLPLCEVVSQLAAAEFRNFGVTLREFYRVGTDQPEVMAAAQTAQVIVFQGHTEHQLLVGKRSVLMNGEASGPARPSVDASLPHWSGVPVVILQTCESLRRESFRQLHALGGVAMIGTGSPIHSASGSGFMKAMSDAVLYRHATLGEALRDARNYFGCLMDLKNLRGHNEQAKVRRTGLSFRLWGDPELELFPQALSGPALTPATAEWQGPDQLLVRPARRLFAEVQNEQYRARIQPGTEVAGMVVRGSTEVRRVLPLYFFCLPYPAGFEPQQYTAWTRAGDGGERGVIRVDPARRLLYVLYFPEPNAARGAFTLQGVKRPPQEHPPAQ